MFDSKHDGVIDFGEFIRCLSIFHPDTPQEEKAVCMDLNIVAVIYFNIFNFNYISPCNNILIFYCYSCFPFVRYRTNWLHRKG